MRYAKLINDVVDIAIESSTAPDGWVACGDACPGWVHADGVFTPPESSPGPRYITRGAFFDRFGAQKYPILASTDALVKALITDVSVRAYIDLDRADLPGGLGVLVSAGFAIDPEAILSAPVLDSERS